MSKNAITYSFSNTFAAGISPLAILQKIQSLIKYTAPLNLFVLFYHISQEKGRIRVESCPLEGELLHFGTFIQECSLINTSFFVECFYKDT
jgi:hypothetical protein